MLAASVDHQRPVADLPSVAERAVEDGPAPVIAEPRDVGHLVVHARCEYQRPRPRLVAVVPKHDDEAVPLGARVERLGGTEHHRGVGGQLLARAGIELGGRRAVVAEEPADVIRHPIALPVAVEQQRAASRATERQCRAQPRHPAADDNTVPVVIHGHEATKLLRMILNKNRAPPTGTSERGGLASRRTTVRRAGTSPCGRRSITTTRIAP